MGLQYFYIPFLIVILFGVFAHSNLDPLEIYKYPPCNQFDIKSEKFNTGRDTEGRPFKPGEFPKWGEPLGAYINAIDRINSSGPTPSLETSISCAGSPYSRTKLHPALVAVTEVAKRTTGLIAKEIESQKEILDIGIKCFHALNRELLRTKKSGSADFQLSGPSKPGSRPG